MSQAWLHMGPQHPVNHGLWTLKVLTDGENIVDAECLLGYLHRCFEKISENRLYRQFIPITNRMCYVAGLSQAYGFVHAVEQALGITDEIPERAQYIRTITLEMQRIASHLVWLAAFASDAGNWAMLLFPFRDREYFLDILDHLTGARMMYNYMRIGGVAKDLYPGFEEDLLTCCDYFDDRLPEYYNMLDKSEVFLMRCRKIGILPKDEAINRGATGPVLRASGVKSDIRKIEPYAAYDRMKFDIPVRESGDNLARYEVRIDELKESVRIIRQALDELPQGEVAMRVPRRVPPTTVYSRIEDPRGELGYYLITGDRNGKKKDEEPAKPPSVLNAPEYEFKPSSSPWRCKIRSGAFSNLSISPYLIIGGKLADLPMVVASVDLCMGEIDR
ncbi:MAG: NADH-quinone oxidoreductase subunit D [Candidatus Heimdallarchaeota archaeon]